MGDFYLNISIENLVIILANLLLIIMLFIMNMSNRKKIKHLRSKYDKFMSGLNEESGKNIEQLLEEYIGKLDVLCSKNMEIELHLNNIERNLLQCVQKVGIVRYNAFEDVGSDLSFSIALLDSNDNGIILSSIYSRDSSLAYAKPIVLGKSKYTLSAEEIQAINIAKKMHRERLYVE